MKNTLILLILFAIASTTSAQTCEIGLDNITVNPGNIFAQTWASATNSQIHGVQRTSDKSGTLSQIGIVCATGATDIKIAIYSDSGDNPNMLLSDSPVLNPGGPANAMDTFFVALNTPISILLGDKIWICANFQSHITGNVLNNGMNTEPGYLKFKTGNPYVNAWPTTLSPTVTTGQYALFLVIEDCVTPIFGCTDNSACNFNGSATDDDGSCEYVSCLGCTNPLACNYDNTATMDDGSCTFPPQYYDCSGFCLNDTDNDGICNELEIPGCTDNSACNFNGSATDYDGSCDYTSCVGCMDPGSCNYDPTATIDGGCVYLSDPYHNCAGACWNDADNDGVCDEEEIPGCMDHTAVNYNPLATDPVLLGDPGACYWSTGCNACDFDQSDLVGIEDILTIIADFGGTFPYGKATDISGDGVVSTGDLMLFLGCFGYSE